MENLETEKFDYVIIGAGCAGLASAQYAARGGLSVLVLDLAGAGGQVLQIADLENYPGVFPAVDGATYMMTMQKQAESFGAKIVQAQVLSIDKTGGSFLVKTKKASFVLQQVQFTVILKFLAKKNCLAVVFLTAQPVMVLSLEIRRL